MLGIEVDRLEEEGENGQIWAGQEGSGWNSSWSAPLLLRVGFLPSVQFDMLKINEPQVPFPATLGLFSLRPILLAQLLE